MSTARGEPHLQTGRGNEPSGTQAGPALALLGIRDQPEIAHCPCRAPHCRIEHRVGIARAIGARPGDLKRLLIVEVSGNRPARHRNANQAGILSNPKCELHALRWQVMAMVANDERARLPEADRDDMHHRSPVPEPVHAWRISSRYVRTLAKGRRPRSRGSGLPMLPTCTPRQGLMLMVL